MRNRKSTMTLGAVLVLSSVGAYAQSSVQLSGLADAYVGSMRMAGDSKRTNTVGSGGMTTSWFGAKGTEDLGGGLKAGFAFTSFMRLTNGDYGRFKNDTMWSRDANVSLSGGFGSVILGRWMAPNFLPTVLFNPFGDSFAFSPAILHANVPLFNGTNWSGTTQSDTGWGSQIAYSTPDLGGLKGTLQYQFRDGANSGKNFGGNLMYFNGGLGLTAFYERTEIGNPVATTYGQSKNDVSNAKLKTATTGLSVPIGAGKLLAAYAHTRNNLLDATRQTLTVGYDYNLSKRTDLYANVMHDRITDQTSGTSFAVGLRHRF